MKVHELFESTDDLTNLEHEVDQHLKAGEIIKPEFVNLKYQIDRAIEKAGKPISQAHLWGKGHEIVATKDDALMDLSYSVPSNINAVLSLKNKLARIKLSKTHPLVKDMQDFYDKYKGLAEKMKALKEKIVTTTQKRAEKKQADSAAMAVKFSDSASLVKVLEQHLDEYIKRAGEMAAFQFDGWMDEFKKHDWDLDKIAPRPKTTDRRATYQEANHKRIFLQSITEPDEKNNNIRKASPKKKKEYVDEEKLGARAAYMSWVAKMVNKIGKSVEKAKMTGNPWSKSVLTVTAHDGETQVWNSKMIINKSKYQKLFNQFPSRRVDKAE